MQTFVDIDARRNRLGIAQKELCERADVNASTYSRCKSERREPMRRIVRKLASALNQIAAERGVVIVEGRGDD